MIRPPSRRLPPLRQLLDVMAALRGPGGCPWDREQDHRTLRWHAVEEVYELMDAIEAGDDTEMAEELGDLLLQVVFHAQLAREHGRFDFDEICRRLVAKLVRRHPHVFGATDAKTVDQVWANWEKIKKAEKAGSASERKSALDGVPRRLPALARAQKTLRKARKAGLATPPPGPAKKPAGAAARRARAAALFALVEECEAHGWSAEELLREETGRRERGWRRAEAAKARASG